MEISSSGFMNSVFNGIPIEAAIFDMDGTLVDSEIYTEIAVKNILNSRGVTIDSVSNLDLKQFYGCTWESIAGKLRSIFPEVDSIVAPELQKEFQELLQKTPPPPVPGSPAAVRSAYQSLPRGTAICTSSNLESVTATIQELDIGEVLTLSVSAEDYGPSKPDPTCYLLAATRLGVDPSRALVFEDSIPGIRAAKAAGMRVIAILHRCANPQLATSLADEAILDYTALGPEFFDILSSVVNAKDEETL